MKLYLFSYRDICKIGVSDNPIKRIKNFPFMDIVYNEKCKNVRDIEKAIKEKFKKNSIGGEFFKGCTKKILIFLKNMENILPDKNIKKRNFGEYEIFYNADGYINITKVHRKIFISYWQAMNEECKLLGNIFKKDSIKKFIDSFVSEMGFSPYYNAIGKYGGSYVHPFLFCELIRKMCIPKIEINVYELITDYEFMKNIRMT